MGWMNCNDHDTWKGGNTREPHKVRNAMQCHNDIIFMISRRSSLSINAPLMTVMLVACRVSSQGNSYHNVFFANRLNHLLRSHEFKFTVPL